MLLPFKWSALVFFLVIIWPKFVESGSFAFSVADLNDLAIIDVSIVRQLEVLETTVEDNSPLLPEIDLYLKDFDESTEVAKLNHDDEKLQLSIASNPISAYRLLRRAVYLMRTMKVTESNNEQFNEYFEGSWPTQSDVNDAISSILRIHHVYDLNAAEFAAGNIFGKETGVTLTAFNCYEIGNYARLNGHLDLAVEWLEVAQRKSSLDEQDESIDEKTVDLALADAISQHDDMYDKTDRRNASFFFKKLSSIKDKKERVKRRTLLYEQFKWSKDSAYRDIIFWGLCTGENLQTEEEKSTLFCWLERKKHKVFTLAPLKMEFLSRNPDVVQIYDFVGDETIERIKLLATPGMKRSGVVDFEDNSGEGSTYSNVRTSMNEWVKDTIDAQHIPKKIELLSGLSVLPHSSSEELQVASYSFGGHYDCHYDALLSDKVYGNHGERIATFMIYLSNVEHGGYTAFPTAGVAARPIKGSAVLWFDVYADGNPDYATFHGACPVIIGQKWVSNKWIRYLDQVLNFKCDILQRQRYQISVNGYIDPEPDYRLSPEQLKINDNMFDPTLFSNQLNGFSYGSVPGLKKLVVMEDYIYHFIKHKYLDMIDNSAWNLLFEEKFAEHLKNVECYMKDYEETSRKSYYINFIEQNDNPAWNILAVYRIIWRIKTYLDKLIEPSYIKTSSNKFFDQIIKYLKQSSGTSEHWPNPVLLQDSITAILSLHHILDLTAEQISSGIINGIDTGITLHGLHCVEIGVYATDNGYYSLGVEWLEEAASKIENTTDTSVSSDIVKEGIEHTRSTHDRVYLTSEGWEPLYFYKPLATTDASKGKRVRRKTVQYNAFKTFDQPNFSEINYWGICKGNPEHQKEAEKAKLFCWYESKIHPYWTINPLKAEFLSLRPKLEVVQFYDVLQDSTMEALKNYAGSHLKKSSINNFDGHEDTTINSNWLISARARIDQGAIKEEVYISKLVERLTGLKAVNQPAKLEISSFSPGSFSNVHVDSVSFGEGNQPARLATVMFHLSNVLKGGEVTFTQAGVAAQPVRGSAIFWYNLLSSGESHELAWIGTCPLQYGENFGATKWLSYDNQDLKTRCGVNPQHRYEILRNGRSKYDKVTNLLTAK